MNSKVLPSRPRSVRLTIMASVASLALPSLAQAAADDSTQLGQVLVTARTSPYRADTGVSALRTDTPLRETPQSVTVLPRMVLEDLQATRVEDALDYAGGFSRGNNFSGQGLSDFNIRGFSGTEYFRNGFPINRGYPPSPDAVAVERIDVMRGPAALLYGRGDPGGTFNIVTRAPSAMEGYTLGLRVNSFGSVRASLDATGALAADQSLRYRLGVAGETGKSFRDFVKTDRIVLAPSLAWSISPKTTLTLSTEFVQNEAPFDRGRPGFRALLPIEIPASRYFSDPNTGRFTSRNGLGQLFVDHSLADNWQARVGIQYYNGKMGGRGTQPQSLRADGRTVVRTYSDRTLAWGDVDIQANLTGKFNTGSLGHTLLLGFEHEQFRYTEVIRSSNSTTNPYIIDAFAPVYYAPLPPLATFTSIQDDTRTYAGYAQDQVSVTSQLKLIAGGRVERYKSLNQNRAARTATRFEQTVVTPRLGAVFLVNRQISLYGSFARSNKPNTARDIQGNVLDPERGRSLEGGVKLDLLDGGFTVSAAVFRIVKNNVSTPDPVNINFRIAAGEVKSQGFDASFSGNLTRAWRVVGGYQHANAKVTRDNSLPIGLRLPNTPRHSASVLSVYEFQSGPLAGFGAGVGVTYMGERFASLSTTAAIIRPYTTANLLAYYPISERARLQVNVTNLFDKNYIERGFGNNVFPGAPFTVTGAVTLRL